ncbi:undecaprenyl/decaprenyl-phosphate alpha-N-acetylglucosaminyl 1-phosphate transferase [Candidatus Sumerlaeota bacterium]|nr:undecaprenyl/decaprenyl-phosphate alpha-N-acetylglucosaminyl 1-phosphate transferase [Candidatus Sumerlaeota bacterium]
MNISWHVIYGGIFFAALVFSLILTPFSEYLGKRFALIDEPKAGKFHQKRKPRSGGIAIFGGFMGSVGAGLILASIIPPDFSLWNPNVSRILANIPSVYYKLVALLSGAGFIFIVGVIDDKTTLKPWTKLFCQIIAAIPLILAGVRIQFFLPSAFGIILTVFWIVLLTNSFNLLDNMDGLSSGIAVIVCIALGMVSIQAGERLMTALFLAMAGSVLGFWYHNFIRSKLFMGDGGSLFIGYMIAALTILSTYYEKGVPTALPVLTPLIILGVPLFDTFSVLFIRFRLGKPLMQGDTNHFSHRLVNLGMTPRGAVIFIYLVTICVAMAALPLAYLPLKSAVILTLQAGLWFVLIFLIERAGKKKIETERTNNKDLS